VADRPWRGFDRHAISLDHVAERTPRHDRVERKARDEGEPGVVGVPHDLHGLGIDDERAADHIFVPCAIGGLQPEVVAEREVLEETELRVAVTAQDRVAWPARGGAAGHETRAER